MTLASQTIRSTRVAGPGGTAPKQGPRGGGGAGGGGRRTLIVAGSAVVLVIGGIWGLSYLLGGPRTAAADTGAAVSPDPAATAGTLTAHPTNGAAAPQPRPITSSLATPPAPISITNG